MIVTIDINFVRMSNKIVWKYPKNHISSLLNITKHFFGLDKSVLSKCKFCAMFYLVEFDDKKNSLSDISLVTEKNPSKLYNLGYFYRTLAFQTHAWVDWRAVV